MNELEMLEKAIEYLREDEPLTALDILEQLLAKKQLLYTHRVVNAMDITEFIGTEAECNNWCINSGLNKQGPNHYTKQNFNEARSYNYYIKPLQP